MNDLNGSGLLELVEKIAARYIVQMSTDKLEKMILSRPDVARVQIWTTKDVNEMEEDRYYADGAEEHKEAQRESRALNIKEYCGYYDHLDEDLIND